MSRPDPVLAARAALGVAARRGGDVPAARRNLQYSMVERAVAELVTVAPPITDEQRDRLATLLRVGTRSGGTSK